MTNKSKVVESILAATNADGSKYFDKLHDMELSHLKKLLKVCILLNK
jgi:hypothetical protein